MGTGRSLILKTINLALVLSVLAQAAWAIDMRVMNTKKDELELEKEVEDMEKYGEAAGQVESDREMKRLTRETRDLERQISRSHRLNETAIKKTKRLAGLYQKKARLAEAVKLQARRAEIHKNNTERIVSRLDSKVKMKESAAIQAVQRRKDAEAEYAQLLRDQKSLERRLRVAEATIKQNKQKRKILRAKSITISRENFKLNQRLVRVENSSASL